MNLFTRLSLVFALCGLLASRVGLLVHEFLGHGGVAYGLGGTVPGWRLFLFGGGWIQYERTPWYSDGQALAISLGGVGLQVIVALIVWLSSRRLAALAARMARLVAMLLCAHACFYLVTGTHYGFGDGLALRDALARSARWGLVLALSAGVIAMAYVLAREGLLVTASLSPARGRRRIVLTAAAVALASALHGGLLFAERSMIDPDETYAAIMQQEVERRALEHLAEVEAQRKRDGQPEWTPRQSASARRAFVRRHRPFPLTPALIGLSILAVAFASWRYRSREAPQGAAWRASTVGGAGAMLAALLIAIAVIDSLG